LAAENNKTKIILKDSKQSALFDYLVPPNKLPDER